MPYVLEDLNLLEAKREISKDKMTGTFIIEPLSPGYGVTIGNSIRRVLLSSLEGYAVKSVKIEGISHEYSTIKGVKEDAVDIILNLKTLSLKLVGTDESTLKLSIKGPKKITAADFHKNASVEILDEGHYIATVEKGGKLELEVAIDKGIGYVPVEKKADAKAPIGTIIVDSTYTPVKKVRFDVENARVGGMTNYNKLVIEIATNGAISPSGALYQASQILKEHLEVIMNAASEEKTKGSKKASKKDKVLKDEEIKTGE
jgi:DNA-directed RNA polymerase subunit alpha